MTWRVAVLAVLLALAAAACAGDDPSLVEPAQAPLPTPAGGVSGPAPSDETSEPGSTAPAVPNAPPPAADRLPFGPTAEDAVIQYVEVVLGESIVGACGAASDPVPGTWCYVADSGGAVAGPIGASPVIELGLIQTSEGWAIGDVAELGGAG